MKYSVVMPCAGVGSRMNLGYNKLLFQMKNGKTVLENTMNIFLNDQRLKEMIICVGENDLPIIEKMVNDNRVKLVSVQLTIIDSELGYYKNDYKNTYAITDRATGRSIASCTRKKDIKQALDKVKERYTKIKTTKSYKTLCDFYKMLNEGVE